LFKDDLGCFGAIRCLQKAKDRKSRSAGDRVPLYNPSWTLFGLWSPPQGSYYSSSSWDGPWHIYDQTLLSPELAVHTEDVRAMELGSIPFFMEFRQPASLRRVEAGK
jgi:hypothetical protein